VTFELGLPEITIGVALLGILQFILQLWLSERFKTELRKETEVFREELRWEYKAREHAQLVAEYLALARQLREDSSPEDYLAANKLSWELAMWLPEETYKAMGQALANPNKDVNELSIVVNVRQILLGDSAGNLSIDNIIHHAPSIGKPQ